MERLVGYIFLSYGRKSRRSLWAHRSASQQRRNIESFGHFKGLSFEWFAGYSRKPRRLADLPVLAERLTEVSNSDGLLAIDDISRLLRRVPSEDRADLLVEMLSTRARIVCVRQKQLLAYLAIHRLEVLLAGDSLEPPLAVRPPRDPGQVWLNQGQTRKARLESSRVRSATADAYAPQLAELYEELTVGSIAPTYKKVAEVANERGITSPRGQKVTVSTVSRALRRLQD